MVYSIRYMRNLSSDDIEKVLTHTPRSVGEGLPGTVSFTNSISTHLAVLASLENLLSYLLEKDNIFVLFTVLI